ncbi:hypothetical protein K456DRAFT_59730, partial [Colletotrichum gloeosporioides 23]
LLACIPFQELLADQTSPPPTDERDPIPTYILYVTRRPIAMRSIPLGTNIRIHWISAVDSLVLAFTIVPACLHH